MRRYFRPRRLLLAMALLLTGLAVLPLWLTRSENISESTFSKIELGMTKGQVERVLNQVQPIRETRFPSRHWLVYSEDAPDRIPPGATAWIEWNPTTDKVVNKGYNSPGLPSLREHLVNRLNTTFGRAPPYSTGPQFFPPELVDLPNQ